MKLPASYIMKYFKRLLNIHSEPRPIALGYALGVFLATSPLMGVHCVLAVSIASALKWNKLAAGIGAFHSNLFTAPLLYSTTYCIGAKILGINAFLTFPDKLFGWFSIGSDVIMAMSVGGLMLGIPTALICYYLSFQMLKHYKLNRTSKADFHENN